MTDIQQPMEYLKLKAPSNFIKKDRELNFFSFGVSNNFYCEIEEDFEIGEREVDTETNKVFEIPAIYIQDVSIPSISIPAISPTNQIMGEDTKSNGSKVSYSPIEISFKLDEELNSYLYFWNWKEQLQLTPEYFKTIRIYITSNLKNIKYCLSFTGSHLTDIGGFQLSSKVSDNTPLTFSATFEFERMWISVIK